MAVTILRWSRIETDETLRDMIVLAWREERGPYLAGWLRGVAQLEKHPKARADLLWLARVAEVRE